MQTDKAALSARMEEMLTRDGRITEREMKLTMIMTALVLWHYLLLHYCNVIKYSYYQQPTARGVVLLVLLVFVVVLTTNNQCT
jgi:hypothetical protein